MKTTVREALMPNGDLWGAEYSDDFGKGKPEDDSTYRFRLWRIWDNSKPTTMFIGLNPSTATHLEDDPTVYRCGVDARVHGSGGLMMANIWPFRSTDPGKMKRFYKHFATSGKWEEAELLNLATLRAQCQVCNLVICAWGNHGSWLGQGEKVYMELAHLARLKALKTTKANEPWHRLYLPHGLEPIDYSR